MDDDAATKNRAIKVRRLADIPLECERRAQREEAREVHRTRQQEEQITDDAIQLLQQETCGRSRS